MNLMIHPGDCLNYLPNIEKNFIDLIICDLPYGRTACKWDSIIPLDILWPEYERILKPNGRIILTGVQPFTSFLVMSNPTWFKNEIIWQKPQGTNPMTAKIQPMSAHESILIFSNPKTKIKRTYNPQMTIGKPYKAFLDKTKKIGEIYGTKTYSKHAENNGTRYPISIQKFAQCKESKHPTRKPVDMIRWLIRTYSNENETILDNAMGSGATLIAAFRENRNFIGIEIEEKYVFEAISRLKNENTLQEKLINLVF